MIFMGRLQFNAPGPRRRDARNLSNLVPAPAFQPMNITASAFDMRHIAQRCLPTGIKLTPECAVANMHMLHGRAVPAQTHAVRRTLMMVLPLIVGDP
jgi:hypothetical protein